MLFNQEKSKVTKQQNVKDPESHKPRVRQPQAPFSPMVYPSEYAPLSKKGQSKDYDRQGSRSFNLEEKLNRLDLLEQNESPTPVQYAPQGPSIQSSHNRNPGDLITQSLFDADDMVAPTPVGIGSSTSSSGPRMRSSGSGGGGGGNDPDDDYDSNSRDDDYGRYPHRRTPGYPGGGSGGGDPPGRGFPFPEGDPPPGDHSSNGYGQWGYSGFLPPGFPGGNGDPSGPQGPGGDPSGRYPIYIPYPYVRPSSPPLL